PPSAYICALSLHDALPIFRRIEVIAALGQATLLLVVGTYAAIEGVRRLFEPLEVPGGELLVFGIIGLVANVAAIAILASSRSANLNMRAAFLKVLNDALGSVGVIVAAIVIQTDRKSTRLNFSHVSISYAVFCLKK